ncbi:hypothetical protein [Streptomyces sp. NPDC060194]|uniref:hypothetical protein n=1 Tax=Streptomyces sp. NPDC060194 TaxID=3347069 RepID=UPI0036533CCD
MGFSEVKVWVFAGLIVVQAVHLTVVAVRVRRGVYTRGEGGLRLFDAVGTAMLIAGLTFDNYAAVAAGIVVWGLSLVIDGTRWGRSRPRRS